MNEKYLVEIQDAIIDGDEELILVLIHDALESGYDALSLIHDACQPGMDKVGELFQEGEAFLPELMMAGRAMKAGIALLTPHLKSVDSDALQQGRIVLGTVKGDLHDIGKTLVEVMLSAGGFEVKDLGVDIPVKSFLEEAQSTQSQIIGASSLLTTSMYYQEELIRYAVDTGIRNDFFFIVGGGSVSPEYAKKIGADGWARSASGAVQLCKQLMTMDVPPPLEEPILIDY
jgi:corrinoid protein of di/trimethylamine methyltransferase